MQQRQRLHLCPEVALLDLKVTGTAGGELMLGGADEPAEAVNYGYELSIPADETSGAKGKVLGSREFARFYKQRPRLDDTRHSVAVNKVLARYEFSCRASTLLETTNAFASALQPICFHSSRGPMINSAPCNTCRRRSEC